jgi:ribosome recycling factor
MAYDFKGFETNIKNILEKLGRELAGVRTGRATPAILDSVTVESYGTRMNISQVANVNVEDARTLRITPWDMSNAKEIEKAITMANLGLSVGMDEKGVRVNFPDLTGERRAQLIKVAKEKVEEAKAQLRGARDTIWNDIQKREKDGKMGEDDKFRAKEDMQKRVDAANKQFDDALERKEKEMSS